MSNFEIKVKAEVEVNFFLNLILSLNLGIPLAGTCPASPALQAGSLPTGRQEGAQYETRLPYREAPACGRGASLQPRSLI